MFHRQILDNLKGCTMERTERGKSGERNNNGVTYLLNDPPITFTRNFEALACSFDQVYSSAKYLSYTECS